MRSLGKANTGTQKERVLTGPAQGKGVLWLTTSFGQNATSRKGVKFFRGARAPAERALRGKRETEKGDGAAPEERGQDRRTESTHFIRKAVRFEAGTDVAQQGAGRRKGDPCRSRSSRTCASPAAPRGSD